MEELTGLPVFAPKAFTPAHAQFLEGLGSDEFWDHAFELAKQAPTAYNAGVEYLYCGFADTYCLLPLTALQEVIPTPLHVTRLPTSPTWMAGVIVWRGEIIGVIDLAAYFLQTPLAQQTESKLVVIQHNSITLSLRVSSVQVVTKTKGQAASLSTQETQVQHDHIYTAWYADGLVLDVEALCSDIVQHIGVFSSNE